MELKGDGLGSCVERERERDDCCFAVRGLYFTGEELFCRVIYT
jgi:hypothetical protein